MFVKDMTEDITADANLFVDDAKVKDVINNEEDVERLQENMEKLYEWQTVNNMKFNGSKFQLLRYGPNESLKEDTLYFTPNMEDIIQQFSSLRDLGVIMSDTGKFNEHIEKVTKVVRQKMGWVMRTFHTRRADILMQLWKTLL